MPKKDLKHNIVVHEAIPNTNITGNGTTAGNIIDTQGYESVTFLIVGEMLTDGVYTPVLTEGNDPALADGAAPSADFVMDSLADAALALTDDNKVKTLGYTGGKRYIELDIAATAVTTGGHVSVLCVLGHPIDAPTATKG